MLTSVHCFASLIAPAREGLQHLLSHCRHVLQGDKELYSLHILLILQSIPPRSLSLSAGTRRSPKALRSGQIHCFSIPHEAIQAHHAQSSN